MSVNFTPKCLLVCLALACAISSSQLVDASEIDPALVQALRQATQDFHGQTTDLDALLWLSTMSERLEKRIRDTFYRVRLLETVYKEAELTGLDPQLVLTVIDIESNFDRFALSHAGAQGLMQVMPFWKEVYEGHNDDLFNPLVSLRYGCTILRHYIDRYDNLSDALAAYNGSLGLDKYPNKVLGRLNTRWQFNKDSYSKQFQEVVQR